MRNSFEWGIVGKGFKGIVLFVVEGVGITQDVLEAFVEGKVGWGLFAEFVEFVGLFVEFVALGLVRLRVFEGTRVALLLEMSLRTLMSNVLPFLDFFSHLHFSHFSLSTKK